MPEPRPVLHRLDIVLAIFASSTMALRRHVSIQSPAPHGRAAIRARILRAPRTPHLLAGAVIVGGHLASRVVG